MLLYLLHTVQLANLPNCTVVPQLLLGITAPVTACMSWAHVLCQTVDVTCLMPWDCLYTHQGQDKLSLTTAAYVLREVLGRHMGLTTPDANRLPTCN